MPNNIENFDAIEWINGYFTGAVSIDFDHLRPILCFSLIWNIFETKACRRHATPASIRRSVEHADESGRLRREKYQTYLEYFRNRYEPADNSIETVFSQLLMTDGRSQEVVRRALLGESNDTNNIVYALLLIAHRIRNNLFHGNKAIESLPRQTDLFTVINSLLSVYLEDIENLPHREE